MAQIVHIRADLTPTKIGYEYRVSDTANNAVDSHKLYAEIEHPDGPATKCDRIAVYGNTILTIFFDTYLLHEQEDILDAIIAAHNG